MGEEVPGSKWADCLHDGQMDALRIVVVDVPAVLKVMVSVSVLLTVAAVVLMFSSARRPTAVTD